MPGQPDRFSCGVALESRLGQAYDEQAFQYLLEIERTRAERSRLPILLLLVDLKEQRGADASFDPVVAVKLFSSLWHCVRETDFVGWYRDGRVAGAVLTQPANGSQPDVLNVVRQRVGAALSDGLPPDVVHRLKVRVYFLRPRPRSEWP